MRTWFANSFVSTFSISLWFRHSSLAASPGGVLINNGNCKEHASFEISATDGATVYAGIRTSTEQTLEPVEVKPHFRWTLPYYLKFDYRFYMLLFHVESSSNVWRYVLSLAMVVLVLALVCFRNKLILGDWAAASALCCRILCWMLDILYMRLWMTRIARLMPLYKYNDRYT